jgi:2-polyprenyl-6-methoxyphenol hydroxylase-like FAD-dependent oxidoreductase
MSGLFAGLMLRRSGWDVDICERTPEELAGRGAGIVAQPALIATLEELGLDAAELGVRIARRRLLDRAGHVLLEHDCPQVLTAWERVYRLLHAAFPAEHYDRGSEFLSVQETAQGISVRFADGSVAEGDLLVGADGLRSSVRGQLQPDAQPLYAGYVGWRALIAEDAMPPPIHRDLFDAMTFCLPPGEQMLGYPVAGPDNDLREGCRRYNMIWYRPADEATELRDLLTDESGKRHDVSIPPPLIRRAAIEAMRADAERLLAPQFAELLRGVEHPILQPIYDLESERLAFGRVAIVGDAAFVARPHVAAGVLKAADDARALTEALSVHADIPAALAAFERARLPVGRRMVARARYLGAYLQASRSEAEQAQSDRYSMPEAVLRETALTEF